MERAIKPKELAEAAGISASYACQILSGVRRASNDVALAAFRVHGARLGLLADMTDADIRKLCASQCPAPDWALTAQEIDALGAEDGFAEPDRVILCDACDRRLDDPATRGCSYADCPHAQRLAV